MLANLIDDNSVPSVRTVAAELFRACVSAKRYLALPVVARYHQFTLPMSELIATDEILTYLFFPVMPPIPNERCLHPSSPEPICRGLDLTHGLLSQWF